MTHYIAVLGLVLTMMCPGLCRAEPPTGEKVSLPPLTVEANREALHRQISDFVRKLSQDPRFRDEALPRWNTPVCFAVAGLPSKQGLFALRRLRAIARSVGVRVTESRCKYNFFVIFTGQPNQLLKAAFRLHPKVFDQSNGVPAIERFIAPAKPQAVRVWHNVKAFNRAGQPVDEDGACGSITVESNRVPINCEYSASRIERSAVYAFTLALVVIDTTFPQQVKLGPIIDYAALAGLADITLNAEIGGAPSILHLFDPSAESVPEGLTPWDEAFLRSLYGSDQANRTQRSQMAVRILHDVAP